MKRIQFILASLMITLAATAQNAADALRYSSVNYTGTARSAAMGNAFGALGADFSSLSINPAGIGVYKTSEAVFTPSLFQGATSSSFFGSTGEDEKFNFNIASAGVILTGDIPDRLEQPGWRNVQFGFGINRLADFNNRMLFNGFNNQSSLLTSYADYADHYGIGADSPEELAYNANLIWYDSTDGYYHNDLPFGGIEQMKSITTEGYMNEMVLSVGANYNDRLYLGLTLGIPYFSYYESSTFTETDVENRSEFFRSFTLREELETVGTGINLKLGVIARPVNWLRLGVAYHTPTFFTSLQDTWSSRINSYFDKEIEDKSVSSRIGTYEYDLTTASKLIGSVAFIFGNVATLSADYQFVDYGKTRLRPTGDFSDLNNAISYSYTSQNIIRVGGEYRYGVFSFRGGFGYNTSPFDHNLNDGEKLTYSAGLGYRDRDFFVDLAYVHTQQSEDYYPYTIIDTEYYHTAPKVVNELTFNNFMVTFGFKF